MSLAVIQSRALMGMHAPSVSVEVHLANGLPAFTLVGLPDTEVREAKDRVRAALQTSGFDFPQQRITVNLAPADLPKEGGRFDLPIALGILIASGQLRATSLERSEFVGELSLTGALRPVRGALAHAATAVANGSELYLPHDSANEASRVPGLTIFGPEHLLQVCEHLSGRSPLPPLPSITDDEGCGDTSLDLLDIKGQLQGKRALEVCAAGAHSLLLIGPPGTGKSMLAQRLPGLLPTLEPAAALETATLQSLATHTAPSRWGIPPYRAPHHSASLAALVGGGQNPRPGEISLAHNGVLFLDELPEFDRRALEALREPLEAGHITISRAHQKATFPARFQLIAAMNPCPCGYAGHPSGRCRCTPDRIARYQGRLSGPLLDRLDICLEVTAVSAPELQAARSGPSSAEIRANVTRARQIQIQRQGLPNSQLSTAMLDQWCRLPATAERLLEQASVRLGLSGRAHHRILRVARTLADLAGRDEITTTDIAEAVQYRRPAGSVS